MDITKLNNILKNKYINFKFKELKHIQHYNIEFQIYLEF